MLPDDRKCEPVTAESVLAMALKREDMERTAAQVRRIMVAQGGDAPSERTLQRHFAREDLVAPRGSTVFGRFEAEAPNVLWTADASCTVPSSGEEDIDLIVIRHRAVICGISLANGR